MAKALAKDLAGESLVVVLLERGAVKSLYKIKSIVISSAVIQIVVKLYFCSLLVAIATL